VVATQTHDQIGNRAAGERLAALVSEGRLRVAAALLLTGPFVPMLFQGEEWAASAPFQYFTDHRDPELGRAVSEGRRREFAAFGWDPADVPDPQDAATFARSKLNWAELCAAPHAGMAAWYTELIALRRRVPALADPRPGSAVAQCDEAAGWLTVRRGPVTVAANLGYGDWVLEAGEGHTVLADSRPAVTASGPDLILPPDSVVIVAQSWAL
jgi:maltooligosyltrehalose trehalohydrolase